MRPEDCVVEVREGECGDNVGEEGCSQLLKQFPPEIHSGFPPGGDLEGE